MDVKNIQSNVRSTPPKIINCLESNKDISIPDRYEENFNEEELSEEELNKLLSLTDTFTLYSSDTEESKEDKGKLLSRENYYEMHPKCTYSPWKFSDGPIIKAHTTLELEKYIQKGYCVCVLLRCVNEVFTKNIKVDSSPFSFLCKEHQSEVVKKYGFGTSPTI
jgi:hypothetical protein